MGIAKLVLTSISSGIISPNEMWRIAKKQIHFSRCELAAALKLGQFVDSGVIQLGCRFNACG